MGKRKTQKWRALRGIFGVIAGVWMMVGVAGEQGGGLAAVQNLTLEAGKIVRAEHTAAPTMTMPDGKESGTLPPRTMVSVVLQPESGSNIRVEVWLPEPGNWNGRFLGTGNGGAAGGIPYGGLMGGLHGGYATATTDMGTAPNDNSGVGNQAVWRDFGYRATHLMTVVGKQIVAAFYGKAPAYSYFSGGSTGGQQALQEAQRYPEDYDGIFANVPAHCRAPLHAYFLWNEQIFRDCPFTDEQDAHIVAAANAYFAPREVPQLAGKMVSDPRATPADIEAVIALARRNDPSLTDRHAAALRKLFDGPRDPRTGERIFNGIPLGSSFKIATGHLYLFRWVFGTQRDLFRLEFGKEVPEYLQALGPVLNAENPDLNAFAKRGGKLLMVSGAADACVPYHATLDYYERVIGRIGTLEQVRSFFRFYLVPGMSHSLGGSPGINHMPDPLTLVVNWREKGLTPEGLAAKRVVEGKEVASVVLYPYPQKTGWSPEKGFYPVDGPRGGIEPVAERFRPAAAE